MQRKTANKLIKLITEVILELGDDYNIDDYVDYNGNTNIDFDTAVDYCFEAGNLGDYIENLNPSDYDALYDAIGNYNNSNQYCITNNAQMQQLANVFANLINNLVK